MQDENALLLLLFIYQVAFFVIVILIHLNKLKIEIWSV